WHNYLKDARKDKKLKELGYEVIRLKESDVLNADNINNFILTSLKQVALSQ
ncbi:unnamed protein product, partial [marine sediment metagenome]